VYIVKHKLFRSEAVEHENKVVGTDDSMLAYRLKHLAQNAVLGVVLELEQFAGRFLPASGLNKVVIHY